MYLLFLSYLLCGEYKESIMFLAQTAANGGFPSEIKNNSRAEYNPYEALTEENLLAKLKRSREHCEEGKYREADKVVSDLRGKYGA